MIRFGFLVVCLYFMVSPSTNQSSNDLSFSWPSSFKRHLEYGNELTIDVASNDSNKSIAPENKTDTEQIVMDVFRLPIDISPELYTLEVETDFEKFTYSGQVEIDIRSKALTCYVIFNSKDLEITKVQIVDKKIDKILNLENYYPVDKNEQFVVVLNKTSKCLIANRLYTLKVEFRASLRNDMSGYYKSLYKENNVTK